MDKFRNKYRIESARLRNWNYGWNGAYFVTICTANRVHYFGEINNGAMVLSEIGRVAEKFWFEIPVHCRNVIIDEFVVMPDHIHGIIVIDKPVLDGIPVVETLHATSLQTPSTPKTESSTPKTESSTPKTESSTPKTESSTPKTIPSSISPKKGSLSAIIRSYKSAVSVYASKNGITFSWQSRYYDHIIRGESSLYRIRKYIHNNPANWNISVNRKINA